MKAAFYKATRPGLAGLYNWLVRKVDGSVYSHMEVVFSDGVCGSSSFMDGGVRLKSFIPDPEKWDVIDLDPARFDEAFARAWFEEHQGMKYDWAGNLRFVWHWWPSMKSRRFCTSAGASALRVQPLDKPWWYGPRKLFEYLRTWKGTSDTP